MRALYLDQDIQVGAEIIIEGDKHRHLSSVIRIKKNQEILLLNNSGDQFISIVLEIGKKKTVVQIKSSRKAPYSTTTDLALSITKKDALETNIRQSVELGIRNIYLIETEYSQPLALKEERINKIIESAIEQSNNPYGTKVIYNSSLIEVLSRPYNRKICFSTEKATKTETKASEDTLLIIGPEGGFSDSDISTIMSIENLEIVQFSCPIMRATTALPAAVGYSLKS